MKKDFPGLSIHTAPIIDNGMSTVDDSPAVLAERELSKRYKPVSQIKPVVLAEYLKLG